MTATKITHGYIYYASTGRRLEVSLDQSLREETLKTIEEVRRLLAREFEPLAHYTRRCHGCSLYSICLPRETKRLQSASFSLEKQTLLEEN
jgi:CRISPR-associated exonuclease Cas4